MLCSVLWFYPRNLEKKDITIEIVSHIYTCIALVYPTLCGKLKKKQGIDPISKWEII